MTGVFRPHCAGANGGDVSARTAADDRQIVGWQENLRGVTACRRSGMWTEMSGAVRAAGGAMGTAKSDSINGPGEPQSRRREP